MAVEGRAGLRGRIAGVAAAAAAVTLGFAVPASAHEPVLLDKCDVLPQTGPLVPVGTDPIGFFGTLPSLGADRAVQITMKAGDTLNVGYGIPNLAPENTLSTNQLPVVLVIAPDNSVTVLQPDIRVPLHNDDFNQDYLFLNNYTATAQAGTYSVLMVGRAPERIFMATGVEDAGFHGIQRGSVATDDQVNSWYSTLPTDPQPACSTIATATAAKG